MILLSVLKWIGLLLLVLLALILSILFIVLFVAVRYRADALLTEEKKPIIKASVRWLFGILRVNFQYDRQASLEVKAAFFRLYPKKKSNSEEADASPEQEVSAVPVQDALDPNTAVSKSDNDDDLAASVSDVTAAENISAPDSTPEDITEKSESQQENHKHNDSLGERIQILLDQFISGVDTFFDHIDTSLDNIVDFLEQLTDRIAESADQIESKLEKTFSMIQDPHNQQAASRVVSSVKRILRHVCPTHFQVYMRAGFDDPSTTGTLAGAAAILYSLFGDRVQIEPVFDETVTEGKLHIKGRIRLAIFVAQAIKLILDRNVIRLYKQLRKARRNS